MIKKQLQLEASQTEFKIKNIAVIKNLVSLFLFSTEINLSKPISRVNIEKARLFQLLLFFWWKTVQSCLKVCLR